MGASFCVENLGYAPQQTRQHGSGGEGGQRVALPGKAAHQLGDDMLRISGAGGTATVNHGQAATAIAG